MDYKKIYNNLINHRKQNPAQGYTEKLTGREHWIAHLLLYKIHKNNKTAWACHMMAMRYTKRDIPKIKNSRMYENIRIVCAQHASENMKIHQKGKRNSQYGTKWICNESLKN